MPGPEDSHCRQVSQMTGLLVSHGSYNHLRRDMRGRRSSVDVLVNKDSYGNLRMFLQDCNRLKSNDLPANGEDEEGGGPQKRRIEAGMYMRIKDAYLECL